MKAVYKPDWGPWAPADLFERASLPNLGIVLAPNGALEQLDFTDESATAAKGPAELVAELDAYFAAELHEFEYPLSPKGTEFQLRCWQTLLTIPYGATCSYLHIAQQLGQPSATRAVGAANGRNPIPVIVPCHRVIGSNGKLTGFGGGLPAKAALLALEQTGLRRRDLVACSEA